MIWISTLRLRERFVALSLGASGLLSAWPSTTMREGSIPGFRSDLAGPQVGRLVQLLDQIDGTQTLLTPTMGGSLPIYLFARELDMPIVLLPIANHDNNQHGANENLRLQNLWDAIEIYAVLTGAGLQP